jgi:hypothetical protein
MASLYQSGSFSSNTGYRSANFLNGGTCHPQTSGYCVNLFFSLGWGTRMNVSGTIKQKYDFNKTNVYDLSYFEGKGDC